MDGVNNETKAVNEKLKDGETYLPLCDSSINYSWDIAWEWLGREGATGHDIVGEVVRLRKCQARVVRLYVNSIVDVMGEVCLPCKRREGSLASGGYYPSQRTN